MDPTCWDCIGGIKDGKECPSCQGSGFYKGEWKHIVNMKEDQWPGMRAAFLYAATEAAQIYTHRWAEFGVWRGNSARYLHRLMRPTATLHLYDSFEGLEQGWESDGPGVLAVTDPIDSLRLPQARTVLHRGFFEDTLKRGERFGFIHIDCDLYESTKVILERVERLPGMVIAFDEFYQGENQALEESGLNTVRIYETDQGQVAVRVL